MILLLGGTKDSREIAKRLLQEGYLIVGTVTTPYGKKLLEEIEKVKVYCISLNEFCFYELIHKEKITLILDATHPYATEISKLAMKVSKREGIPYIRFERRPIQYKNIIMLKDIEEAVKFLKNTQGNIMLTIGSKNLEPFVKQIERKRFYVRVLPTPEVIAKCNKLGIDIGHIIGMQGPFSKELNQALYKQYHIQYMITKESGEIGGTLEKVQAALELGIQILMIERPSIEYEKIFYNIEKLIDAIKEEERKNGKRLVNCRAWK
ncbi:cobalt-precorrin-6A reductase [Garciella nitratireducens]|uniref:Precorrin-6A/cobalt-precorrin-6A reductase n=1 Tax=Garciella nitratireducens DSM 15102 TaxID=1121911 RepID=A0A1T4KIP2_9FIRM|nr:cobalt-precorrin-6A reductase [Garciella nitratireducens]SJZ42289.1 precorrin-6A/cobalt-precorrin-6A reductase [Garciella nitratireducens DSM 15102]